MYGSCQNLSKAIVTSAVINTSILWYLSDLEKGFKVESNADVPYDIAILCSSKNIIHLVDLRYKKAK